MKENTQRTQRKVYTFTPEEFKVLLGIRDSELVLMVHCGVAEVIVYMMQEG